MKELKKRFLIGMLSGVLIFTGGLGAYHFLNTFEASNFFVQNK